MPSDFDLIRKAGTGEMEQLILEIIQNNIVEKSIDIYPGRGYDKRSKCVTTGSILTAPFESAIYLGDNLKLFNLKRTAVHHLLHCLGFQHEYERKDAELFPLAAFDPYSVMLSEEDKVEGISELDKVGLNLIFPPCTGTDCSPEKDEETGMYYCGREVMERHNIPYANIVDRCERGGPNCPACRTLGKPKGSDNKWQGWSGFVYCGEKKKEPDGEICGPHNGLPCEDCRKVINYNGN